MGPHSAWHLLQDWLPASALPLEARAAFAAEMTEVARKEGAEAVGGVNCSTSVPACSNISRHRAVAFRDCRWEGSLSHRRRKGGVKGRQIGTGRKLCQGKEKCSCGTKQTCCPHNTLPSFLAARWTHRMFQREKRYKAIALPLKLTLPSSLVFLCQRNRNDDQVWTV